MHQKNIHTALDSNGPLLDEPARKLLDHTDLFLLDVKHIDNDWHKRLTSLSNDNVLKVGAYRESTGKPIWLRYVLVPGWTDQPEHLHAVGRHFENYKTIEKIEIQPFHQLGKHKWEALSKPYQLAEVPPASPETISLAIEIFEQFFKEVKVN